MPGTPPSFAVRQAEAGIWKTPLDSSLQDALGLLWATQQSWRSGLSSDTGLIHVIELPLPGNLSDWVPHSLTSARQKETLVPFRTRVWERWRAGSLGHTIWSQ